MKRGRLFVRFAIRLVLIGPFCILAGWWLTPAYVWVVGQWAGHAIQILSRESIDALRVEVDPDSVLRTGVELVYESGGGSYPLAVTALVGNLAPYVALVLASPVPEARRQWRALAIGAAILFATHMGFVTVTFVFRDAIARSPEWTNGLGLFVLTLPFLLWIALVYWKELWKTLESLQASNEPEAPPEQ